MLEANVAENEFYELFGSGTVCVQVADEELSSSYIVMKNAGNHLIVEAASPCDQTSTSDFAVRFKSWESFNVLINDLTCSNIGLINRLQKNLIVLPSKYVASGFTKTNEDYTPLCEILENVPAGCSALTGATELTSDVCG